MKKALLVTVGVIVVLAVVVYVGLTFFLGSGVKAAVNKFGPKLTQSPVELGSASLSPVTGAGTLKGLSVGNPPGWSDRRALFLGTVDFRVEPSSVFGEPVIIDHLVIDQPEINYETKIVSSNIQDLLKNIEASTGKREPAEANDAPARRMIVKKFVLTNAKVTVGLGTNAVIVTVPNVTLENLGVAENGLTPAQLSIAVMRELLRQVVSAAGGSLGGVNGAAALEKAKDAAKEIGDGLKSLFEKKP